MYSIQSLEEVGVFRHEISRKLQVTRRLYTYVPTHESEIDWAYVLISDDGYLF